MNLLRLEVNGQDAVLPTDFNLTITLNSPILEQEQQGSMSLPGSLPVESNQHLFAHAHNPQSRTDRKANYDCRLWYGSHLLLQGKFQLQGIAEGRYQFNIVAPPAGVDAETWDRACASIPTDPIALTTTQVRSNFYSVEFPPELSTLIGRPDSHLYVYVNGERKFDYYFPKQAAEYYGNDQIAGYLVGNDRSPSLGKLTADWTRYSSDVAITGSQNAAISQIEADLGRAAAEFNGLQLDDMELNNKDEPDFLMIVHKNNVGIVTPVSSSDYTVEIVYKWYSGVGYRQVLNQRVFTLVRVVYDAPVGFPNATTTNTPDNSDFVFPTIYNPNFYDPDKNKGWFGFINAWEQGKNYRSNDERARTGFSLVPQLWLTSVIDIITDYLGFLPDLTAISEHDVWKYLLAVNHKAMDRQVETTKIPFIAWKNKVNLSDHLPTDTIKEFFDGISSTLCGRFLWNERQRTVKFVFLKDVLDAPEKEDWTGIVSKDPEIATDDNKNKVLAWSFDQDDTQTLKSDVFDSHPADAVASASGTKSEKVESRYAAFEMLLNTQLGEVRARYRANMGRTEPVQATAPADVVTALFPRSLRRGTSDLFEQKDERAYPRLLFWIGSKQVENNTKAIITADIERKDSLNKTYALVWGGETGIYERLWKEWFWFLNNTVEIRHFVPLTMREIANMNWALKRHIRGLDYLIRSINFTATMQGVSKSKVTLWQV